MKSEKHMTDKTNHHHIKRKTEITKVGYGIQGGAKNHIMHFFK